MPHRDILSASVISNCMKVFPTISTSCTDEALNCHSSFCLQSFPSCSIESFQKLPKICSTWSLWCQDKETQEGAEARENHNSTCDQSTSQSSANLFRVPPKRLRHHRKMPFRRRNWCGCIQVRKRFS